MAIEMYTGFVGSGKSFHAVREGCLVADSRSDKWVIANFPIKPKKVGLSGLPLIGRFFKEKFNEPRWIYKENDELTVEFLVKTSIEKGFYGHEGKCLLIWDEAGVSFNARDWNTSPAERKGWIKFLSQSRKFGYDVIFITQDGRMLDRQIRNLCEFEVQHKKMNGYSMFKLLPFTWFSAVKFWNGMKNMRGTLSMCIYNKKTASRYDTMGLFDYAVDSELEQLMDAQGRTERTN